MFEVPDTVEAGLDAVTHVQAKIDAFDRRWRDSYPAAVRILLDRPRVADPLPAHTTRALDPGTALQLHRTHFRCVEP